MTKVQVRTRQAIPRRIRAGVQFGPKFAEHELTDKQLARVMVDSFLEVKVVESAPQGLEGAAKDLVEQAAKLDGVTANKWLETEKANDNRKTVVKALEDRIAELAKADEGQAK